MRNLYSVLALLGNRVGRSSTSLDSNLSIGQRLLGLCIALLLGVLSYYSLAPQLSKLDFEGKKLAPHIQISRARWKIYFSSNSQECTSSSCKLPIPRNEIFYSENSLENQEIYNLTSLFKNKQFWVGLRLNLNEIRAAADARADKYIIGHINAAHAVFVDGKLRAIGDGKDFIPTSIDISNSVYTASAPIEITIFIDQNLSSERPIVIGTPLPSGLFTDTSARLHRDYWILVSIVRPALFAMLTLFAALIFISMWMSNRVRLELLFFSAYSFSLFLSQFCHIGFFRHGTDRIHSYSTDLLIRISLGALGALVGFAFARLRETIIWIPVLVAGALGFFAFRASNGAEMLLMDELILKYFVTSCFFLSSLAAMSQAATIDMVIDSDRPRAKWRSKQLWIFSALNFCLAIFSFASAEAIRSIDVFAPYYRSAQPLTIFLIGLFLAINHKKRLAQMQATISRAELATQVAHDIRAPLSALKAVLRGTEQLSQDQQVLVQNASYRIQEIANDLLKNEVGSSLERSKRDKITPIAPVVAEIFAEFNLLNGANTSHSFVLQIESPLAFASISEPELKRALSNLINNSIEASVNGQITLKLKQKGHWIHLEVSDEGAGIPQDLIAKLGYKGVSFGKSGGESGSGLGLYHAKRLSEEAGGELRIESAVGKGTTITLRLPAATPDWLPSAIQVDRHAKLVVIDDDPAISELWRKRLSDCALDTSNLLSFHNTSSFKTWLDEQSGGRSHTFLIDQNITGSPVKGLELIVEKHIAFNSILVTSLSSDPTLQAECKRLGVRLLPKELISFVPIASTSVLKVLLDDDSSIQTLWKITAKRRGVDLEVFSKSADLLQRAPHLDRRTEIFLDESLGDGEPSGSDVAEQLGKLGFKTIFLCTGFNPGTVSPSKWIRKVIGKEPPWV